MKLPLGSIEFYHLTGEYRFLEKIRSSSIGFGMFRETPIISEHQLDPQISSDIREVLETESSYGGEAMRCFIPRHGIRFLDGYRSMDFLICLECHIIYLWDDSTMSHLTITFDTVKKLESLFPKRPITQ